jgi:hypothetical protein
MMSKRGNILRAQAAAMSWESALNTPLPRALPLRRCHFVKGIPPSWQSATEDAAVVALVINP